MKKIIQAGVLMTLLPGLCAVASELAWQQTIGEENNWSRVTYAGTLLVASDNQLAHYDSATGEQLWLRDDLNKLAQFNVRDVSGTPFLVVNEQLGNIPPKNRLQVLNISSGETIWDTGVVAGNALGGYPVLDRDLLVIAELRARLAILDANDQLVCYLGENEAVCQAEGWPNNKNEAGDIIPTKLLEAGKFNSPHGLAADADGNLYVAEWLVGGRFTKLVKS